MNPLAGIGFGISSSPSDMNIQYISESGFKVTVPEMVIFRSGSRKKKFSRTASATRKRKASSA